MNDRIVMIEDITDKLHTLTNDQIAGLWVELCGDNDQYDKGGIPQ